VPLPTSKSVDWFIDLKYYCPMYIRKVEKKDGKYKRTIYRLVKSYRTENGPRQETILNMKDLNLPQEKWKILADAIEAKLNGQLVLYLDKDIDFLATHYTSLIQEKCLAARRNMQVIVESEGAEFENVNIKSVKNDKIRSIGAEYVALSMYKYLKLDELFTYLGFNEQQRNLAVLSIVGRLVNPGSERATREWAMNRSGLDKLLNTDFQSLSNNALYRIADSIYDHKETIESHLQTIERDLFNLNETLVLYDLTNTYFEGRSLNNPKAQFGHSKEKRKDCRLITLGLIIDEDGFPKRSQVMAGNQNESKSLLGMIAQLENKSIFELEKAKEIRKGKTVVIDAGIATSENLAMLNEYGYDYIAVAKGKPITKEQIDLENLVKVRETKQNKVEVQLFKNETENILFCRSFLKSKKEISMLDNYRRKFEEEMKVAKSALTKKRGIKEYEKVIERIGRIKERNSAVARYYTINVIPEPDYPNAKDITWKFNDYDEMNFNYSGSYCLRTSRQDLDEEELWKTYTTLTMVEAAFKCLKSELAFRPVFHRREYRADSHLFIGVLAYHLLNSIRIRLKEKDIHLSWNKLREILSTHSAVTTSMKTKSGEIILIQQASQAEYIHNEIYKTLGLSNKPLSRVITKY